MAPTQTTTKTKIEKAFDRYEREVVRLPNELNRQAQEVHPKVRKAAESAFPGETNSWLGGSYGRKTQAGPTLKDIDVLIEFNDVDDLLLRPPSTFLEHVAKAVLTCELVRTAEPRRRAVECTLHDYEFTVDIVPGICHPDGKRLYLANHSVRDGVNEWQLLNPRGQLQAAQSRNGETDGLYIRLVRVVKYWNQQFGKENKPLRSYHVEALVYHSILGESGFVDGILAFFDHAHTMLAPGMLTPDPGDSGQYVDQLLEDHERHAARARVAQAREKAHEAAALDDADEAGEVWGQIFPGFPSPGMSSSRIRRALVSGTGITGTGISPDDEERARIKGRSWRPS
jgi:hypothetical protein